MHSLSISYLVTTTACCSTGIWPVGLTCVMDAAAVAAIGGLGFLASKLDVGFVEFFREAIVKVRRRELLPRCRWGLCEDVPQECCGTCRFCSASIM